LSHPLFRAEAIAQHRDRLSGEVSIATPLAWQVIGWLMFGGLVTALTFLSLAGYARVETVSGVIVPNTGVAAIIPQRAGVIEAVRVREGQRVEAGAPLVAIRADEDQAAGPSAGAQVTAAIAQQDASLAAQIAAAGRALTAQAAQVEAQRRGLVAETEAIAAQIALQRDLIRSAETDLARARTIADRGFISGRELQVREETLLARRQGLSQLEQSLSVKRASIAEAERSVAALAAQTRAERASLGAARAQVAQQAASAGAARGYVLRAPVNGRVTAVLARVGQAAGTAPLLMVVPDGAQLQAELAIPAAAIGFVRPGQEVRLALDAFPYQRFGTVKGRVVSVSASAVPQAVAGGGTVPVYPAIVALDTPVITAYGREQPLLSGMTLTARIVAERQSLIEWLLDPLFAAGRF
jgi:membrane fusion protein